MTAIEKFMKECNAVCAKQVPAITGLRKRSEETGLTLKQMRLVAAATCVKIVADGKELKVVPSF